MAGRASTEKATDRRILEAATRLFSEQGYHGTSMREVAAAVGIRAASLYNHYPGKEDLLVRIATGVMEELLAGGQAAIEGYDDPSERLRALVVWHVTYHAEERLRARVADEQLHAISPQRREAVLAARDAYTSLFKEILADGQRRCGWHVPSVPVLTFGIGGMCTFVDTWFREDGPLTAREVAEIYADFILAGLRPGDDRRPS